jgi:hypothetical protein
MAELLGEVTAVLMAKDPRSTPVKSRLQRAGGLTPALAGEVAEAMLLCTAKRLAAAGGLVLAVTPDGVGRSLAGRLGVEPRATIDQGPGDIGERLLRVWRRIDGPVAFFGADSPDVPDSALAAIPVALRESDLAIGPTGDGGYWVLASGARREVILTRIDWGTDRVYDQTLCRAEVAGLRVRILPAWHDTDRPEDVDALRQRLRSPPDGSTSLNDDAPLRRLAERLDHLCARPPTGTPA